MKTSNECRFTHLPTSLVFTVAGLVGEEILACVFSLTLSSVLTCSRDYLSKYCKALLNLNMCLGLVKRDLGK